VDAEAEYLQSAFPIARMPDGNATGKDGPRFAIRHYSVGEIAALWNLSDDAVRKIFENEPGVLLIGASRSNGRKRRYVTIRVPEDVAQRVHSRLTVGSR
jgi:hypothetical protein